MTAQLGESVDRLKALNATIARACEQAEAHITEANRLVDQLAQSGLPNPTILLGRVVLRRAYSPRPGGDDSGEVLQAALAVPGGFGIVAWDSEELAELSEMPDTMESVARGYFIPFADCEPALRGMLGKQAERLLVELFEQIK
jgi:hypothetical protein